MDSINLISTLFSLGSILYAILGTVIIIAYLGKKTALIEHIRPFAFQGSAAVALVAMLGSLYYSDVVGFLPCEYCWYQRIAMYSLAGILTLAVLRNELIIRPYALLLSVSGFFLSLWHLRIQWLPSSGHHECKGGVPCTGKYIEMFGFITIPFMALSSFFLIISLLLITQSNNSSFSEE